MAKHSVPKCFLEFLFASLFQYFKGYKRKSNNFRGGYLKAVLFLNIQHRQCQTFSMDIGPPYPWILFLRIQEWMENIWGKNSRKFEKAKLQFAKC